MKNRLFFIMIEITFLGTGTSQGIPIIGNNTHPVFLSNNPKDKRLRTSALISWNNYNYVIDCGPDFREQMMQTKCKYINGLFFTHEHADHTAGLDDIRPFFLKQGNIPVYLTKKVAQEIKKRYYYMFQKKKYPGVASVNINKIKPQHPFFVEEKKVIPIIAQHGKISVLGYRIDDFAYFTDVKTIKKKQKLLLKNLDVLVLNALQIKPHPSHLNLDEALALIIEIQPKRTYFTHISHLLGFHDKVAAQLPENVFLAYDFLKIKSN